jgi:hypothetical protein
VAFDEGDHVIFEAGEIVRHGRHIRISEYGDIVCRNRRWPIVVGCWQPRIGVYLANDQGPTTNDVSSRATLIVSKRLLTPHMLLSKEYVGYLAREVTKKLIAGEFIETKAVPVVTEKVHAAMLEEFTLEDRINDEVRVILEAYSSEMQKTGANYQEMFRKVKSELVRKYKAVL